MATKQNTPPDTGLGHYARRVNVGAGERLASLAAGAALALWGLRRRSLGGLIVAAAGAALGWRGASGHSSLYATLGVDRAASGTVEGNLGIKIERSVTVDVPRAQVFRIWRNVTNLPRIMSHLERVEVLTPTRSRWVLKPLAGTRVEWQAEIINETPDELIAWRTVGDALVQHAGSVRFEPVQGGRATLVSVSLQYAPPGGELGHAVASLFGEDAGRQIDDDLRAFKPAVESGRLAAA
jgi:uncharacterized membrane protein